MGRMGERDKGYAWIILAAATLGQACSMAVTLGAIGSLYVEILNYFPEVTKTSASWVASFQTFTIGIMGGILVPVVKKRGCRVVCVVGVLLGVVGLLISTFTRNIQVLYVTYGFCSGFANASLQVTSFTAVLTYFHRRRALALGVMLACGYSVGFFVGPPLTVYLVETFSLPGTFTMMAGIMFQCVWLGCLFRPLNVEAQAAVSSSNTDCQPPAAGVKDADLRECAEVKFDTDPAEKQGALNICRPLVSMFGLEPCKNGTYLLFFCSMYLSYTGYMLPYTFLILRGVMAGETEAKSALLVTVLAAVAMVCSLLTGVMGDYIKAFRGYVCCGAVITSGGLTMMCAGFRTYYMMLVYAVGFGSISAIYIVLQGTIVVDYWGTEIIEYYSGHVWVAFGLASFTMSPISGMLIDVTDSTTLPFIIFGSLQIFGGCVMLISIILQKRKSSQHHI